MTGSMATASGVDPRPTTELLRVSARVVKRPGHVGKVASIEETSLLANWAPDEGAHVMEIGSDPTVLT